MNLMRIMNQEIKIQKHKLNRNLVLKLIKIKTKIKQMIYQNSINIIRMIRESNARPSTYLANAITTKLQKLPLFSKYIFYKCLI